MFILDLDFFNFFPSRIRIPGKKKHLIPDPELQYWKKVLVLVSHIQKINNNWNGKQMSS